METERPHRSNSNSSSSTSELFVCFTSRLSSSSMKLSSKSLLSPSRTSRDPPPQISLSSSLSRRLRSNGSIKGGGQASPMFPATATVGGKRRGCGFENPEPSSPKVTCIGQVRVKTKKQGKKMRVTRSKSKRRTTTTTTSEASFRRTSTEGGGQITNSSDLTRQNSSSSATYLKQQHRNNQKWVHLPLTICEALREFNCFFPCRSSCMRDKGYKGNHHHHHHHHHHHDGGREGSSCGAAFARWLHLALQEGKEREIEVVMREEENDVEDYDHDDDDGGGGFGGRSHRRHVFEDIDIDVVEGKKKKEQEEEEEEEKGRVSICVPPKNALLLMRCRSDPVKMAALANRFWDSPVHKDQHQHQDGKEEEEEEDEEEEEEEEEENNVVDDDVDKQEQEQEQEVEMEEGEEVIMQTEEKRNSAERETEAGFVNIEEHNQASSLMEKPEEEEELAVQESCKIESRTNAEFSEDARESNNQNMEEEEEEEEEKAKEETEAEQVEDEEEENHNQDGNFSCVSNLELHSDLDKPEETSLKEEEKQENDESSELYSIAETLTAPQQNDEAEPKTTTMPEPLTEEEASTEEEPQQQNVAAETPPPPPEVTPTNEAYQLNNELGSEEREIGSNGEERESEFEREKEETLPECLLLMMCEPKLSMEVSKETWVCSTDFIRWLPERPAGKNSGAGRKVHAAVEGRNSVDKKANAAAPLPPVQPGRSSCSFPAAPGLSMAAMIEQRLAAGPKSNAGYEPFVLTRCKSEPMRTTAKLAADACFWKKPHAPPPTLGVGAAAGVGF